MRFSFPIFEFFLTCHGLRIWESVPHLSDHFDAWDFFCVLLCVFLVSWCLLGFEAVVCLLASNFLHLALCMLQGSSILGFLYGAFGSMFSAQWTISCALAACNWLLGGQLCDGEIWGEVPLCTNKTFFSIMWIASSWFESWFGPWEGDLGWFLCSLWDSFGQLF